MMKRSPRIRIQYIDTYSMIIIDRIDLFVSYLYNIIF